MPILQLSGMKKQVGDFRLGPIDLAIERGTITALIGNNGAGKSTLLKLILNLVKKDAGHIFLEGDEIHLQDEGWKQSISYQAQTIIGYEAFTGQALKQMLAPLYPTWDEELFDDVVRRLDIPLRQRFGKLSQGSQQKLAFALTIARNTALLILDEPTAHIDIPSKKIMGDILIDWMDQGEHTIIISSHQVEDIKKLADYLCLLRDGDMLGFYEKGELSEQYARFWLKQATSDQEIPHVVAREALSIISENAGVTEAYLLENKIEYISREQIDLEEIITILLTKKRGGN